MKKLLVVVDMQKDFIDGALGTEEAVKIVEPVAAKIEKAKAQGEDIIFTKDTHYKDYLMTQEGRKLPVPHCVKGTQGWELDERIRELAHGCRILEKSSFGSMELAVLAQQEDYEEIELAGLCTDICVISNALLLKAYLPEVPVKVASQLAVIEVPVSTREEMVIEFPSITQSKRALPISSRVW